MTLSIPIMKNETPQSGSAPAFRDLYPHLHEAQLADAEERFDRYIALAVRIFERLRNDPTFPDNLRALTGTPDDLTIERGKVD